LSCLLNNLRCENIENLKKKKKHCTYIKMLKIIIKGRIILINISTISEKKILGKPRRQFAMKKDPLCRAKIQRKISDYISWNFEEEQEMTKTDLN
jgi:hypothetical protein